MRDRVVICAGLAIFLGLVTFPAWRGLSVHANANGPNPALPKNAKQCVEPLAYMRTSHMKLLLTWRDNVVRLGRLDYVASDGRHYNMNLTATCLTQCHGARASFCDRCHAYAAVTPPCWSCHLDSSAAGRVPPAVAFVRHLKPPPAETDRRRYGGLR